MKSLRYFLYCVLLCFSVKLYSQNISVNSNTFTDQELIEDVLFGTNCVEDINVTNTVSGNFNNGVSSYGYFEAGNSNFPFSDGIVLSTGRLDNVPGPNDNLSDDDAPNWNGDQDLEDILGINNTINATIFEFSFVPQASSLSFRYIFASEEYRENNSSTCNFSDAFAFLVRPVGGQFENLALVPGTNIPVQVTTVRPEIPGACDALNEEFFGQFNNVDAPINFNGQTAILTAETEVVPGETYEVKLVIADEANFRFDSAVFIEGSSFNVGVDLGQDQILCQEESTTLQIQNEDAVDIRWFYEDQLLSEPGDNINVSNENFGPGLYSVEVDLPSGCTATDDVIINFDEIELPANLSLSTCVDASGIGVFNLFDIATNIPGNLQILNFYLSANDAESQVNSIQNPNNFQNTTPNQDVYVSVLNANNCSTFGSVTLSGTSQIFNEITINTCPVNEGNTTIFESQLIQNQVAEFLDIQFQNIDLYNSQDDALNESNAINTDFIEIENEQLPINIFGRISNQNNCLGLVPIVLERIDSLIFQDDQTDFLICDEDNGETNLNASLSNPEGNIFYEWNTGETTENISVNEAGSYNIEVTSVRLINGLEVICSTSKSFTVDVSSLPEVSFTQTGFSGNGEVVISADGLGDYEFALNNTNYTDNNIFNINQLENIIYVRDKKGCGEVSLNFIALEIPDFFTPNNDGFNDYWHISGIRQSENDIKSIFIFDRYGKLLARLSPKLIGWDGNHRGIQMPAQDYWYKIQMHSGQVLSGHFSLMR